MWLGFDLPFPSWHFWPFHFTNSQDFHTRNLEAAVPWSARGSMKSLWVLVPGLFPDQLQQLWFKHQDNAWRDAPVAGLNQSALLLLSLSLFLEGHGFSWREQLPTLCWAVMGEGGKREGFAHCPQQAALPACDTLTALFWEQMCCLVQRALSWEVGELGSGPKEFGINISHLPGEHPALWLLCSMRWGRSISSLLSSTAVHKSVQNMGGRRWNKQGGVWPCGTYIRGLWDLQGLDLPPFVTSGPYLWFQYMSPWNRIRFPGLYHPQSIQWASR